MKLLRLLSLTLLMGLLLMAGRNSAQQVMATVQENAATPAVASGLLFGATSGSDGNFPSVLYSINPTTGAATAIGPIGFKSVSAMDFHPTTGVLYATGRRVSDGQLVLITINPATGAGTEIGLAGGFNTQDMSFRNSDATLFAYRDGSLFTLNLATGASTFIGNVNGFPLGNAIAFSPTDTLYYANERILGSINPATGKLTTLALLQFPAGLGSVPRVAAMDFRPAYAIPYGTVITNSGATYLVIINTATGEVIRIGQTVARLDALAWSPGGTLDICVQDDKSRAVLSFNSTTGDYIFTDCGKGTILIGRATLARDACKLFLSDAGPDPKRPDRSVTVLINTCTHVADAAIDAFAAGKSITMHDSDITNNTCACR